jgi:dihydropteroate synthase
MLKGMNARNRRDLVWSGHPGDPEELLDAGVDPAAAEVEALVARGRPVKAAVTGTGSGALAAAAVYAWLGVAAFEFEGDPDELRQVLDMVASMAGTRPPAVGRRALA